MFLYLISNFTLLHAFELGEIICRIEQQVNLLDQLLIFLLVVTRFQTEWEIFRFYNWLQKLQRYTKKMCIEPRPAFEKQRIEETEQHTPGKLIPDSQHLEHDGTSLVTYMSQCHELAQWSKILWFN